MSNLTFSHADFQSASVAPSWPQAVHDDAYYGLVGEVVGIIEPHSEADNMALLIQFLVGMGNIFGRGHYFSAQAVKHHSNLFVTLVGDTAKARKGSSWGPIAHILSCVDPIWFREKVTSGLSSGEGLAWHVRDPFTPTKGSHDPGIEDKRLLVIEEEFASILKMIRREGNTLSPLMRNAWDGKPLRTLTKNSPVTATGAHISVIGHITSEELRRCLTETESANGFGNRFLWMCVRRSKPLPDGGEFEQENIESLVNRLRECVDFARCSGATRRDDEARTLWHQCYAELSDGQPGLVGSMTARREAQVMRLAQIYALLDKSNLVKAAHLKAAIAVEQYAFNSSRHLFGGNSGDPTVDAILAALESAPQGLSRSDISRKLFQRNKPEAEISRALRFIEDAGHAIKHTEPTNGRPVERWQKGGTTLTTYTR